MKLELLKNSILDDNINDKNLYIKKDRYFNTILLLKVIVALIYAFYLGYNLFYFGEAFITYGVKFVILLSVIYLFIDIPYNLFKILFIPGISKKDTVTLYINPLNFTMDIGSKKEFSKTVLILVNIMTIIVFSFIPNLLLMLYGFNIYTYAFASASTIYIIKDLIYIILLILNRGNTVIINPYFIKVYD